MYLRSEKFSAERGVEHKRITKLKGTDMFFQQKIRNPPFEIAKSYRIKFPISCSTFISYISDMWIRYEGS